PRSRRSARFCPSARTARRSATRTMTGTPWRATSCSTPRRSSATASAQRALRRKSSRSSRSSRADERNPKPIALGAAVSCRLVEALDEQAAIAGDHALRRDVVDVGGELHVVERRSVATRFLEQERECSRRVAEPALPRHYREADVPEHMRRQLGGARLPAEADDAAEFAVPHPSPVAG